MNDMARGRRPLGRGGLAVLGLTAALGSLAIHAVVPVLAVAAHDLGAAPARMQLAVSLYLAGLAVGQFLCGGLSDRFGRKRVLLAGILLYLAGSAGAGLATAVPPFLASRIVQAIGGACGLVVARAMVVDASPGADTAGRLSLLATIVLMSPALSPLLGGLAAELGGWRAVFAALFGFGLISLVAVAAAITETRAPAPATGFAHGLRAVLARPRFRRIAAVNALATAGMFVFVAGSSFLLRRAGYSPLETGLAYLSVSLSLMAGVIASGRFARSWGDGGVVRRGAGCYLAGGAAMTVGVLTTASPFAFLAPMMVVAFGAGLIGPAALAAALRAEPRHVGTASSLFGTLQIAVSAGITGILSLAAVPNATTMAVAILCAGIAVNVLAGQSREVSADQPTRPA